MSTTIYLNFHSNLVSGNGKALFLFGAPGETARITNGNGFDQSVTLNAQGFSSVSIPDNEAMSGTGITDKGFTITSPGDIAGYFSNRANASTDLTVLFNAADLGTVYRLASYTNFNGEGGQFSVRATADLTDVVVRLPDGQSFSVTLDAGKTFKFATGDTANNTNLGVTIPLNFDLTGAEISATAPVAVFSGANCTNIGNGFCDHIVEQMPPVSALSQSYVVGEAQSPSGNGNNLIRVIAASDGTIVTVDGVEVATIDAGEFHEFTLSQSAAQIDTSHPALVAQYLQGAYTAGEGDPAMMFVPGQDTWLSRYKLATPAGVDALAENYANVVIPTAALPTLTLDGVSVDTSGFSAVGTSGLSVGNVAIAPGLFEMLADQPFQLSLFGYDSFDSYLTFGAASFASGISNFPPSLSADALLTDEATAVTGNVLANDVDPDGDAMTVTRLNGVALTSGPVQIGSGAMVTLAADGTVRYDPNSAFDTLAAGETATDSFTYSVGDGNGGTSQATVTVTINGVGGSGGQNGGQLTLAPQLPNSLAPGQAGTAVIDYANATANLSPTAVLIAATTQAGLVADPFTGAYSNTVFLLADGDGAGQFDPGESGTLGVLTKGTGGPNSTLGISVQAADMTALTDLAARYKAALPSYVDPATADRLATNVDAILGTTVGTLTDALAGYADGFESLGRDGTSATAALALALQEAGDFGAMIERGTTGSLGRGWASLADLGLDIAGGSVRMAGFTDLSALVALNVDSSAIYTLSQAASRSVTLSGNVVAYAPPQRPEFQLGDDGSFASVSGFDGTLVETANGYEIHLDSGELLEFGIDGTFVRLVLTDGREITASHDAGGEIVRLAGPNGASLDFSRDASGMVTDVTDADGNTASFAYGGNQTLDSVTRDAGISQFTYDGVGDLVQAIAPGNIVADICFCTAGRLTTIGYAGGLQSESFTFDGAGSLTITDGAGRSTALDLLPGGIAGRVTDGTGNASELVFGTDGALTGVRAPDGSQTGFQFDNQGRLVGVTDANGAALGFTYSQGSDRPVSFTDAGGNTRSFTYDAGGRILDATWADGTNLAFAYDAEGNLTGYTNRRGDGVSYTYDARGRLLSESDSSAGPTSYGYDAQGRLASATNDQGTTTLLYDSADRITEIHYPTGKALFYTYDAAGNRASISDGGSYNVFYDYDALGRLTGLRDENGSVVTYGYDASGNLVQEANGNGTVTNYAYDAAGRVTLIENLAPDTSVNSRVAYTYDAAGQRVAADTHDGSWSYGYDATGQLVSADFSSTNANIADKSLIYVYDAAGNRTQVIEDGATTDYIANGLNQYTQAGAESFTYDADGNMTSRSDGSGTTTYGYDSANRLISVVEADGTTFGFEYDLFGNRVAKIVDGVRTDYLVDPFGLGDVLAEYDGGGTQTAAYMHGLGLAAAEIGGATAWYDADAVGSVTTLTDATGAVANAYAYAPFGTEMFESETLANDFEFNGVLGIAEDSDDLTFMRARSYSDELGRFLSEDPLWDGEAAGNLYIFALNDPATFNDPSGLETRLERYNRLKALEATVNKGSSMPLQAEPEYDSSLKRGADLVFGGIQTAFGYGISSVGSAIKKIPGGGVPGTLAQALGWMHKQQGKQAVKDAWNNVDYDDIPASVTLTDIYVQLQNDVTGDPKNTYEPDNNGDGIPDNLPPGASYIPPVDPANPYPSEDTTQIGPANNTGNSNGDPHLSTFDRLAYDFQGKGEFILFRTTDGASEVQVRQEPWNNSTRVTINTAVATKLGDHTVGVYLGRAVPLLIDGVEVDLASGESIAVGNGSVSFNGGSYLITDEFGNGVYASGSQYSSFMSIQAFIDDAYLGKVEGLLGNADGDRTNDFALDDGTVLAQPMPQDVLYGAFADAWRIDQAESFFVYLPSETTDTFTDPNFPNGLVYLNDLDPTVLAAAQAEAVNAGLTPGTVEFDNAVLDIALTGDVAFAQAAANLPDFSDPLNPNDPADVVPLVINQKPVAADDTITMNEDVNRVIDVLANDSDPEGDGLTLLRGSDPAGGTVTVANGKLRFLPSADFSGLTTLSYLVADTAGNQTTGTLNVKVREIPDAPTALSLSQRRITENAVPGTVIGNLSLTDPDVGDSHTYRLLTGAGGRFEINGTDLVVAPNALIDFERIAQHSVTIEATDGAGLTTQQRFIIDVDDVAVEIFDGTTGDDRIFGDVTANTIMAFDGNDRVTGGLGDDTITLGSGRDVVLGTLLQLFGDTVTDFGAQDALRITNAQLDRSGISYASNTGILSIDENGDGIADGPINLPTGLSGGDFMAVGTGTGGTIITFETFLPTLQERVRVDPSLINGIATPAFLNGRHSQDYVVTFEAGAVATLENTVGVYEINALGDLINLRILTQNALTASGSVDVTGVDPANALGFFLVQDGNRIIDDAAFAADQFEFLDNGAGGFDLASQGIEIPDAVVFFSHRASLNPDGKQHVVSGVSDDGRGALRLGFEDLMRNGVSDDDFEDVLLYVDVA